MLLKSISGSPASSLVGFVLDLVLVIRLPFLLGRSRPFFVIMVCFCWPCCCCCCCFEFGTPSWLISARPRKLYSAVDRQTVARARSGARAHFTFYGKVNTESEIDERIERAYEVESYTRENGGDSDSVWIGEIVSPPRT